VAVRLTPFLNARSLLAVAVFPVSSSALLMVLGRLHRLAAGFFLFFLPLFGGCPVDGVGQAASFGGWLFSLSPFLHLAGVWLMVLGRLHQTPVGLSTLYQHRGRCGRGQLERDAGSYCVSWLT